MFDFEKYSLFSLIALLSWPIITAVLFSRSSPVKAAAQSLIWGVMWLPEAAEIDLPILPPIGKNVLAALMTYACLRVKSPKRFKHIGVSKKYQAVFWVLIGGIFITTIGNQERLIYGNINVVDIKSFELYDALNLSIDFFFKMWVPITLGRAMFRSRDDVADFLKTLVSSALVYGFPILWEARMSPQLHNQIYGFFARTDFSQNVRLGGFRPTVFMGHGLIVAMFMYVCFSASLVLKRMGVKRLHGMPMWFVTSTLFFLLIVCKSMGPLMYAIITYCMLTYIGPKWQRRLSTVMIIFVLSYPITRMFEIVSTDDIVQTASMIFGPDRAQSLQFRFDNEDLLLAKGAEKLWFGWGSFGRDHVYDQVWGKDLTVQDGYWIIQFGQRGAFGFMCSYIILAFPIIFVGKLKRVDKSSVKLISALVVIASFCTINTLPNMDMPNIHFILMMGIATLTFTLKQPAAILRNQHI